MAKNPTLSSNSPTPGYISWTAFHMVYLGKSYAFPAGNTNFRYVYWKFNGGAGSDLQITNDANVISALTDDDCLLFLNKNGAAINALSTSMLYGDLIVPGTILTEQLAAHSVQTSNLTLEAAPHLIPNGSFNELDKTDPTKPAYWVDGVGDGTRVLDSVHINSATGYSVRMSQTVGPTILTAGNFNANITGWTATGATISWQSGWSSSGQMLVSIATAATTPTLTSATFPVVGGKNYNLLVNIEADGTGSTPTSSAAISQGIQWIDASGSVISTSTYVNLSEPQVTTAVDAFDILQQDFIAPTGSIFGRVVLGIPSDPTQATLHYIDYVRVEQSTYMEMWSSAVPVTAGEWVKVTFWAVADVVTTDTLISALHFHPSNPVFLPTDSLVVSLDPVTGYSTVEASADLGFATTWTKYTGTVQIPDGMNFMRMSLGTEPGTYQTVGTYNVYFDDANVENISSGNIQSSDFVPGVSGWALLDAGGTSQVDGLQVLGDVGADSVSANSVSVAGQDLMTDVLDPMPLGLIAHGLPTMTSDTAAITSPEAMLYTFNVGATFANRVYRVSYGGHTVAGAGQVADDFYSLRLKFNTDGSVPNLASPILDRSTCRIPIGAHPGYAVSFTQSFFYLPSQNFPNLTIGIAGVRDTPDGGTLQIESTDPNLMFWMSVEDMGAASGVGGTMQQVSKPSTDTSQPELPPKATYTKKFYPNESRSYDSDGSRRAADASNPDMFQGRYSSIHGNQMSCAVYDYSAIQSALTNASQITVKLSFRVKHSYLSSGLNVSVHQHTYSGNSTPSTYKAGKEIATKTGCKEGSTYTITLPSSFATALQSGTAKGIGFGKPGTTNPVWYGYMYGSASGSAPVLTITYTK